MHLFMWNHQTNGWLGLLLRNPISEWEVIPYFSSHCCSIAHGFFLYLLEDPHAQLILVCVCVCLRVLRLDPRTPNQLHKNMRSSFTQHWSRTGLRVTPCHSTHISYLQHTVQITFPSPASMPVSIFSYSDDAWQNTCFVLICTQCLFVVPS